MPITHRPTLDATWDYFEADMAHEVANVKNTGKARVLTVDEVNALIAVGAITPVTQIGTEHKHRPLVFGQYLWGDEKPVLPGQVSVSR